MTETEIIRTRIRELSNQLDALQALLRFKETERLLASLSHINRTSRTIMQ